MEEPSATQPPLRRDSSFPDYVAFPNPIPLDDLGEVVGVPRLQSLSVSDKEFQKHNHQRERVSLNLTKTNKLKVKRIIKVESQSALDSVPAEVTPYCSLVDIVNETQRKTNALKSESEDSSLKPKEDSVVFVKDLKIANLPNTEGYLEKKGDIGMIKQWKKRYFVLLEDRMLYFKDKEEKEKGNLVGFIVLSEALEIKPFNDSSSSGHWIIYTMDRVWHLQAENRAEMIKWVEACKQHQDYIEDLGSLMNETASEIDWKTHRISRSVYMDVLQGYLTEIAKSGSRQRWYVIKDGTMYKFKTQHDTKPVAKYILYRCTLTEIPAAEDEVSTTFKLILHNHKLIIKAPDEETYHKWMNFIVKHREINNQILGKLKNVT